VKLRWRGWTNLLQRGKCWMCNNWICSMNEITNSNILNSKYSRPSTWDIAHPNYHWSWRTWLPYCPTLFMESELNFCWSAVTCCFWIKHRQTIGRGYQWNLSSTIKKRNLHNPSFRSTHSFNPVLHFLHKKNIKLPMISSSNGWQNT
jgi:hypothetical protein